MINPNIRLSDYPGAEEMIALLKRTATASPIDRLAESAELKARLHEFLSGLGENRTPPPIDDISQR